MVTRKGAKADHYGPYD